MFQVFFTWNGQRLPGDVDLGLLLSEPASSSAETADNARTPDALALFSLQSHCEIAEARNAPPFLYKGAEVRAPPPTPKNGVDGSSYSSQRLRQQSSLPGMAQSGKHAETPRRSPLNRRLLTPPTPGRDMATSFWDASPSPRGALLPFAEPLGLSADRGPQQEGEDFLAMDRSDFACGLTGKGTTLFSRLHFMHYRSLYLRQSSLLSKMSFTS
jgi:hypothetical protein